MSKHKNIGIVIITICLTLGMSLSLQSLLASWTAPTAVPPSNNASEPINRSSVGQDKIGGLVLNSGNMSANGLVVSNGDAVVANGGLNVSGGDILLDNGRAGFGDANPSESLSIGGPMEFLEGFASPSARSGHGKLYSKLIAYASATDAQDKLMLHMDGTGAAFVDSSVLPKTITVSGATQVTSKYKFGSSSAYFNGSSYLMLNDSEDWNFGTGNFTIDFWFSYNGSNNHNTLIGQADSSGSDLSFQVRIGDNNPANNYLSAQVYGGSNGNTQYPINTNYEISDKNWHHCALVRNGATLSLYLDGVSRGSVNLGNVAVRNSASKLAIGKLGEYTNNGYAYAYIDELRISKGVARWTANFTPNTAAYGSGSSASALFYMDGAGHEYQLGVATAPSAPSGPITLIGGTHTSDDCSAAGGVPFNIGDGTYICKFNTASCASGWTQHESWSETVAYCCTQGWTTYACAGGHYFMNMPVESVWYALYQGDSRYCMSNPVKIGCK